MPCEAIKNSPGLDTDGARPDAHSSAVLYFAKGQ